MDDKSILNSINNNDNNLKQKDLIIDYFMIIGLDKKYYCEEHLKNFEELKKVHPIIVSRFPSDRERYPFNQNCVNQLVLRNIFPLKEIDFIKNPKINDHDSSEESIYKEYIVESDVPPKNFFHIFSVTNQSLGNINESYKHFACFIVFEDVSKLIKNRTNKKLYIAKALVITSIYPYYSLFKLILENIFNNIRLELCYPIELLIYNIIEILEKPVNKKLEFTLLNNDPILIEPESLLPICDINIFKFFNLFSLDDFLIIAERHLYMDFIYFFSEDLNLLSPTCFAFLTLLFPLNFSGNFYYPILISEGPKYKTFFFEPCIPMILLFYGKYEEEFMMKNFSFKGKPANILIVDIDRKTLNEIRFENNKYSILKKKKIENNKKIPSFKEYNSDIYFEITSYLNNYNNKNKNCTYFDKLSIILKKEAIYIRENLFTFFIKIINFYVNCVSFRVNENLLMSSNFDKTLFMNYAKRYFPNKEKFYDLLYSNNFPLRTMINKNIESDLEEKDIKNFLLMEELIKFSLNKNIIYFETHYFLPSNESMIKVSLNDDFFENHSMIYDLYSNWESIQNDFQISINKQNGKLLVNYFFIPNLIVQSDKDKKLLSKNIIFEVNHKVSHENLLFYELNMMSIFIEKCFVNLSFNDSIIFSYILVLAIQINSFENVYIKRRKIAIVMKILSENDIRVNFIYSLVYNLIIENDRSFEKEYFDLLIARKINPSLYIFLLNKKKNNNNPLNISIKNDEKSVRSHHNIIKFQLIHDCKYFEKSNKNLYDYFTKFTHYNSTVYFDCYCKQIDLQFKNSLDNEIYPLIGGPITYLRQLIIIILNYNTFTINLSHLNSRNRLLLLSISFYAELLNLNYDEILIK